MRVFILTFICLFACACTAGTQCGNYHFFGVVKITKSQQFYLQVFPNNRRMYRLKLSGEKLKWAPFLNRSVEFSGDWLGTKQSKIGLTSNITITRVSNLNTAPAKLEKSKRCL